jgi:hypothetical protein
LRVFVPFLLIAGLLGCVRPEQEVLRLDPEDPKYNSAPCLEIREAILYRGDTNFARGALVVGTGVLAGPVSALVSSAFSAGDNINDYELVEILKDRCVTKN